MDPDLSNIPANANPFRVQVVGASGEQITDFGGSTLPAGAATSANQVTGNSSLATIATNTGTVATNIGTTGASSKTIQGTAADNATAVGSPVRVGAKYNATLPTYGDGDAADQQADINGRTIITQGTLLGGEDLTNNTIGVTQKPVASSTYSPSSYKDAGTVTKANVKSSAGNVYALRVTNTNAAVRYFQLHNKGSAPAAGETAQQYWAIPAGTTAVPGELKLSTVDLASSEYFATGIGFAVSTTATTFTDSATASEHNVTVRFV